jgi:hypothetical protein
MQRGERLGNRPDLAKPILELCVEDWFGLWEIAAYVARALREDLTSGLREAIRDEIAEMASRGWLEASIWSNGPPRPMDVSALEALDADSELWKPPMESKLDEELRVAASDAGAELYFGGAEMKYDPRLWGPKIAAGLEPEPALPEGAECDNHPGRYAFNLVVHSHGGGDAYLWRECFLYQRPSPKVHDRRERRSLPGTQRSSSTP